MAAANTDKVLKVGVPGTATTLAAPGHNIAGDTINVISTTNWPTDTAVAFAMDMVELVNGVETRIPGTYTEWVGVVNSSTSINNMVLTYGTDQQYPAGSLTRVYIPVTSTRENRLAEAILAQHKQNGAHGAITADSVTSAGAVSGATGAFSGAVSAAGVNNSGDLQVRGVSVETIKSESLGNYVATGLVWSGDAYGSTRAASMTAGVAYINGKRVSVAAVTARAFTASRDTYIDLGDDGVLDYNEVTNNNTTIPALAANHIRLGIIVTGASNIANRYSVNQGQVPDQTGRVLLPTYSLGVNRLYGIDFNANVLYPTLKKRLVGGSARDALTSTGAPGGSEVSYNGCNQIRFICKPNTNYRVHFYEPALSGASGSGLFGVTPYLSTSIGALTRALTEMGMFYGGTAHGVERTIDFNSESVSGLAYIEFRLRSSGWSGTMSMNSDTSRTNQMWIEELQ